MMYSISNLLLVLTLNELWLVIFYNCQLFLSIRMYASIIVVAGGGGTFVGLCGLVVARI